MLPSHRGARPGDAARRAVADGGPAAFALQGALPALYLHSRIISAQITYIYLGFDGREGDGSLVKWAHVVIGDCLLTCAQLAERIRFHTTVAQCRRQTQRARDSGQRSRAQAESGG